MADEAEVYDNMGDFYDLVYSDDFDSDFYIKEARACGGKVLELGCGTGRITMKLIKAGMEVTGLDISETMLELLEKNAAREGLRTKTHLGDMRDFRIQEKFRLAIFPYRSFLHILTDEDRKKTLGNVYSHLEKGGRIIIHIYSPSENELKCRGKLHEIERNRVWKGGRRYDLIWFMQYHPEDGTADYAIDVKDEKGNKTNRFEMKISFIGPEKLKKLLEETGFRNIKLYGGFDYERFDGSSQEVVVVAEK